MGVFGELKILAKDNLPAGDGVEKLVKFKQDILLEAAHTHKTISDDHFTIVKGGACEAYALAWISRKLKPSEETGWKFSRSKGTKSRLDAQSIFAAAELAKDYVDYVDLGKESDFSQASDYLAERYGLGFIDEDERDDSPSGDFMEVIRHCNSNLRAREAAHLSLPIQNSPDTHAVALFKGPDQHLYFFDPNVGEYRIRQNRITDFFQKYESILANNTPPWKFGHCLGRRVVCL